MVLATGRITELLLKADQTRKMVYFSNSIDLGLVARYVLHHSAEGESKKRGSDQPASASREQQHAQREPSPATCAS